MKGLIEERCDEFLKMEFQKKQEVLKQQRPNLKALNQELKFFLSHERWKIHKTAPLKVSYPLTDVSEEDTYIQYIIISDRESVKTISFLGFSNSKRNTV